MSEHESEVWQTNTDHMLLECQTCKQVVKSWDITSETVSVRDITLAWSGHAGKQP